MSRDLIVYLRANCALDWSIIDDATTQTGLTGHVGSDEALSLPDIQDCDRTFVILPSECVFVTRISLPTRSSRAARQAAPFLIEDELGASLDETQVCLGPAAPDGQRLVYALSKDMASSWRDRLAPILGKSVYTIADCGLIETPHADLTLRLEQDRVLYAYGSASVDNTIRMGGALPLSMFDLIGEELIAGAKGGYVSASRDLNLSAKATDDVDDTGLDALAHRLSDATLKLFPVVFESRAGSRLDWSSITGPFRRAAQLAAVVVVLVTALYAGEALYLRHQTNQFDSATVAAVQAQLPNIGGQLDPTRAQRIVGQRMASANTGDDQSGFLVLTAILAELTASQSGVSVDHIRYDSGRGELAVTAIYQAFSDFDAMSENAAQRGVRLRDLGSRETERGIEGEFSIGVMP